MSQTMLFPARSNQYPDLSIASFRENDGKFQYVAYSVLPKKVILTPQSRK